MVADPPVDEQALVTPPVGESAGEMFLAFGENVHREDPRLLEVGVGLRAVVEADESTRGGCTDTEAKALAVRPAKLPCSSRVVTTVTPAAKRPTTALNAPSSIMSRPIAARCSSRGADSQSGLRASMHPIREQVKPTGWTPGAGAPRETRPIGREAEVEMPRGRAGQLRVVRAADVRHNAGPTARIRPASSRVRPAPHRIALAAQPVCEIVRIGHPHGGDDAEHDRLLASA